MSDKNKEQPPDAYGYGEDNDKVKETKILKSVPFTETEEWIIERRGIKLFGGDTFSYYSTHKREDGTVKRNGSSPCNVDPDWGTYDINHWETIYESFDVFIEKNKRK